MITWYKKAKPDCKNKNDVRIAINGGGKTVNITFSGYASLEFGLIGKKLQIGTDIDNGRIYFRPSDDSTGYKCVKSSNQSSTYRISSNLDKIVKDVKEILADKCCVETDLRRSSDGLRRSSDGTYFVEVK